MIKTLQRKFIAIAMCSVVFVLATIIGSINIINYVNINQTIDARLDILAENGGGFPSGRWENNGFDPEFRPNEDNPEPAENIAPPSDKMAVPPTAGSIQPDDGMLPDWNFDRNKHFRTGLSAETPFDTRYFTVTLDSEGTVTSINTGNIAAVSESKAQEYAQNLFAKGKSEGFINNYKYRVIYGTNSDFKAFTMYIFLDCEREMNTFESFLFASIAISLTGILLVFLLVVIFSRIIVKPVAESYEKQKRFITDASHELKTPLTVIDANTEVLEMEQGENEWTESIHNQTRRLAQLTEKLVFLSRMDEESTHLTMLVFSLSDAVEEAAHPFSAVAAAQQKSFQCSIEPNLTYCGDEASLRQLVSLLLDNAMKYSTENGEIRLTLSSSGKNRILTVWNTADGLTPGKQDILFERFYRPDNSRNLTTGGHGIGLSVVKAIVTAHKGRITAKSEDGKSIAFTVTISS